MENTHFDKVTVAVTGATGAMGGEVVSHLLDSGSVGQIKILVRNPSKGRSFLGSF